MNRKSCVSFCVVSAITIVACAKQPSDDSVLQASDLTAAGGAFSANEIVDLASFTDDVSIDHDEVQKFLEATPYGAASFLDTYSSNGVRAADAILATAQRYTLNPLVFLVRAEMDEGLIGQEFYPSSPVRVEYVFGCGCAEAQSSCDPALAGFDVQVDCLGSALRESLGAVAANGHTDGGWAPNVAMTTLDGVRVTPKDASTAALYQYTPRVAQGGAGGNWLFWNLWQKYAAALAYKGATGSAAPTASIGDACTVDGNCAYQGGVCATNYPGGLCTATCTAVCPTDPSNAAAFCANFQGQGGYCLPVCNPSAPACRAGYTCERVAEFGDAGTGQYVCTPN
jgi:hypothetical protein